jgi:hypothetical protein
MRRFTAVLLSLCLAAVPVAGCGDEEPVQTADQFCATHGGVQADSTEPDGDATCEDGTEFEADGDSSESGSSEKKSTKKKKRK